MLEALIQLRKKAPITYSIVAVNIDPNFSGYENHKILEYCQTHDIECRIIKTKIKNIIDEKKKPGSSFCSFCARLKRGAIYTAATELGITKIALGHHRDDLNETLLLNLFFTGQLKSMAPVLRTDDGKHTVIRPLIYASEDDIRVYSAGLFPIICCKCPVCTDEDLKRRRIKRLLRELEKEIPQIKQTMLTSMGSVVRTHLLDRSLYSEST